MGRKTNAGRGAPRKSRKREPRYAHRRDGRITARHTVSRMLTRYGYEAAVDWLREQGHPIALLREVIRRNTSGMDADARKAWFDRRGFPQEAR